MAGVMLASDGSEAVAEEHSIVLDGAHADRSVTIHVGDSLTIKNWSSWSGSTVYANQVKDLAGCPWMHKINGTESRGTVSVVGVYTVGMQWTKHTGDGSYLADSADWTLTVNVVDSATFAISFDAAGGTGAPPSETRTVRTSTLNFTLPASNPTWSGHVFAGWNYAGETHQAAESVEIVGVFGQTTEVKFVATWTDVASVSSYTYRVVYDAAGGRGAPETYEFTSAAKSVDFVLSSTVPTKGAAEFLGWSGSADGTVQPGAKIVLTADGTTATPTTVLRAVWSDDSADDGRELPDWVWYAAAIGLILIVMMVRV